MAETERTRPRAAYVEEAVSLALESRWDEALAVNRALLEKHGPDEDTLNRMGKALTEMGRYEEALAKYSESFGLNPLNPIAQKNVRKLSTLLQAPAETAGASRAIDVDLFAEEPGRSALTVLNRPRDALPVAIAPGDPVEVAVEGASLLSRTERGVPLGTVEAKLARRLLPLIATGNRYTAAVARVEESKIEIMIQEAYQAPENSRKSSFPISRSAKTADFRPYAKESLLLAREIGSGSLDTADDDVPSTAVAGDDEPLGLPALDGDLEETASLDDDEDDKDLDDDIRPEDEY